MKGHLLAAVFAALFTTSTYAHPRGSDAIQFKVSIDVAEVTEDPTTFAVLFFAGAKLCPSGDFYTRTEPVNCSEFIIGGFTPSYSYSASHPQSSNESSLARVLLFSVFLDDHMTNNYLHRRA